jgi:AcrR family transcriptional regulator
MKVSAELPLPTRILLAAFITFTERGYEKASMDEVALVAGTTKRTVYAHFGNKEALFRAAISQAVERFFSELPEINPSGDPETELTRFASRFSDLSTWRRPVLLQRVVIGESERLPDLGEMLHRDVIVGAERRIADFLKQRYHLPSSRLGDDADQNALVLASFFLNMATGPKRVATLMEARKPAPAYPLESEGDTEMDWVRLAVQFFLGGLQAFTKAK